MSHTPTAEYSILAGGIITDVKHEAPAPAPTPDLHARQNPVRLRAAPAPPPQDIANAAQFPASNFATLTSGESLVVDGEMPIEPPTPIATRLTGLEV